MPVSEIKSLKIYPTPAPMSMATLTIGTKMLHISGQVAQDMNGDVAGKGDITSQSEKALDNIKALVEEAGGSLSDICRIVVYLIAREDLPAVMGVRRRMLAKPYPATTAVVVKELAHPDLLIEIEATAVLA